MIIKKTLLVIAVFLFTVKVAIASCNKQLKDEANQVGKYVFVSFSMNDSSLRSYYAEAQKIGAKLIMRGFVKDEQENNVFIGTKKRVEKAKINIDINPTLFESCKIEAVPAFAIIEDNGDIYKTSGHITLSKALEIIERQKVLDSRGIGDGSVAKGGPTEEDGL